MPSIYRFLLLLLITYSTAAGSGDVAPDDDRHEQGRDIYNYRCYFCHGYSGDAKTLTSTYLNPAPRDFTGSDPQALPRQRMIDVVTSGKPGTAMHGFSRVL